MSFNSKVEKVVLGMNQGQFSQELKDKFIQQTQERLLASANEVFMKQLEEWLDETKRKILIGAAKEALLSMTQEELKKFITKDDNKDTETNLESS